MQKTEEESKCQVVGANIWALWGSCVTCGAPRPTSSLRNAAKTQKGTAVVKDLIAAPETLNPKKHQKNQRQSPEKNNPSVPPSNNKQKQAKDPKQLAALSPKPSTPKTLNTLNPKNPKNPKP